jgi:hypothetical protein
VFLRELFMRPIIHLGKDVWTICNFRQHFFKVLVQIPYSQQGTGVFNNNFIIDLMIDQLWAHVSHFHAYFIKSL